MEEKKVYLGQLLVEREIITRKELSMALKKQKKINLSLGEILIKEGFATEEDILFSLSQQLNIPFLKLRAKDIDSKLMKKVPIKLITHYDFIPLREEKGVLTIAVNDPLNICALDEIRLLLKRDIKAVIATRKDIANAIKKYYGVGAETVERMISEASQNVEVVTAFEKQEEIGDDTGDPSVIKFVNQIFLQALQEKVTDIHLEPYEDEFKVRYRVDGVLYKIDVPAAIKQFQAAIISRIKVMADLNIAEKRLPQDGRMMIKMKGKKFDLRISILPTLFGESVDVRILSPENIFLGLENLGLSGQDLQKIDTVIRASHGIILVTGPTGSGKTTTLYACLEKIKREERKIITVEDPIEYQIKGITQLQVHSKIGLTFATALRSMLRHDPDIMLVGEIRDLETAEIAVRSALTGHLIFSTLHTNDACGAITRLSDMGIEPYLISSPIRCVIAQRLVRKICPNCKERVHLSEKELKRMEESSIAATERRDFYKGKGCEQCHFTGYKGRTAIYEIFILNDEIKEMVAKEVPTSLIKEKAISQGMKTLQDSGWEKVEDGVTTAEEVMRVT